MLDQAFSIYVNWDALAFFSSLVAGVFLLIRRHMLHDGVRRWHSAPHVVQFCLSVLSIYMGGVTVSLLVGYHAGQREAVAYLLLAITAVVMVVNLDRNGRIEGEGPTPRRDPGEDGR